MDMKFNDTPSLLSKPVPELTPTVYFWFLRYVLMTVLSNSTVANGLNLNVVIILCGVFWRKRCFLNLLIHSGQRKFLLSLW